MPTLAFAQSERAARALPGHGSEIEGVAGEQTEPGATHLTPAEGALIALL